MSHQLESTERFVDPNFPEWYDQGLPPQLSESFPNGIVLPSTLDAFEGQELPDFETALTAAMEAAHEPRNAYHNIRHSQRATENASDGYDALTRLTGLVLPAGFLQPILLGTAGHDHGHPGTTFFADAAPDRLPTDANPDMAVEWYSAMLVSRAIAEQGGTPEQQLVAAYIPAASAYGANEDQGKRLNIARAINPVGIAGRMMRAVDVTPDGGDYAASVSEDTGVLYGEKMAGGKTPPSTLDAYLANRIGFLRGYVLPTFDSLDSAVGAELTSYLGWRQRAERRFAQLEEVRNGTNPVIAAILRSTVEAQYGITLK